jgi:cellulose synthase/poly-beta-1,6-N-acetylglucosamine synthase-like glycosyltransferase
VGQSRYSRIEVRLTLIAICVTSISTAFFLSDLGLVAKAELSTDHFFDVAISAIFGGIILIFFYGNLAYFVSRIGSAIRHSEHAAEPLDHLLSLYDRVSPSLTVLVPSYQEDELVIRRTLLSAALMEYPNKQIVLLIDDLPNPRTDADARALALARQLPQQLQELVAPIGRQFVEELAAFLGRLNCGPLDSAAEAEHLARLYRRAAQWLEAQGEKWVIRSYIDSFFVERVLREPAMEHQDHAEWLSRLPVSAALNERQALREYQRLAGLFSAGLSSFERKRFANLSHEPNKAMNLNGYLGVMGRNWRFVSKDGCEYLEEGSRDKADLCVPGAEYVLTLDADSFVLNDYALRLVDVMEAPGNGRLAVAQTPYSAFAGTENFLERIAGATTDIQYLLHQGFTRFQGTYWVGANALIRRSALEDIAVHRRERGFAVPVYIQDRTVIEDTESSIDLISKGWTLYNYPERLAYSATPADYGSLLIQRRRWANGGLIIFPKLLRHIFSSDGKAKLAEAFVRVHYLISPATTSIALLLLLLLPFEEGLRNLWLGMAAAPYFVLYGRDLVRAGYRWRDLFGVYALNLLLLPINLGGALRSLQQAVTGRKVAFGRTPKVEIRTAAPPLYIWATASLLACSIASGIWGFANGDWARFVFSLLNTIAFSFAVTKFIGVGECIEDGLAHYPRTKSAIAKALAFRVSLDDNAAEGLPSAVDDQPEPEAQVALSS